MGADSAVLSRIILLLATLVPPALTQQRDITVAALPGRRVALVVGNREYPKQPLANPVNDATDLASALRGLRFDTTLAVNVNRIAFERSVRDFAARIQPGDAALFFFAGHGMEVEGQNYLLPVDFDVQAEEEVKYQAMPASLVLERMQNRGARVAIIILDACRNNPFRNWGRGPGGGLANMSGSGVYVAFAAAPGKTASDDVRGNNGRFTKYLLAALNEPGLGLDELFNRVRTSVAQESGGAQVPFSNSGLIGRFVLREGTTEGVAPVVAAQPLDLDLERYNAVKDSRDSEQLESVAARLQRAELAEILRERAKSLRGAVAPAPVAVPLVRTESMLPPGPARYAGLKYGDTLARAQALFGRVKNRDRAGNQFIDRSFWIQTDVMERITNICVFQHSAPFVEKQAGPDPLLSLVGKLQSELIAALGPPATTKPGIEGGLLILNWPFQIEGRIGSVGAGIDKNKKCYGIWVDWPNFR
jgi:uncharacterized caspase-like protein